MRRADPVLLMVLLVAQSGYADGSYNHIPAPAQVEAPTSSPETAAPAPTATQKLPASPARDPDAQAPQPEPERGDVCIYGPKGLVHRPRGKDCAESLSPSASADRGQRGRCILGAYGQVLYAPPGVSCEDMLQVSTPPQEERRPRARRRGF